MALKVDRSIRRTTGESHTIGDIPYVDVAYNGKEYFAFQKGTGTYEDMKRFHRTMIAVGTNDATKEKETGTPHTSNPFAILNANGFGSLITMVPRRQVSDYVWETYRTKEPPTGPLPGADEPQVDQTNLFGQRSAAARVRQIAIELLR